MLFYASEYFRLSAVGNLFVISRWIHEYVTAETVAKNLFHTLNHTVVSKYPVV